MAGRRGDEIPLRIRTSTVTPEQTDGAGPLLTVEEGEGPLIALAVHHGHAVRPDVERLLALEPTERRREEDPFTGRWTALAPCRIVVHRSRFEVDMNRAPEEAVYRGPEQAWGLDVWRVPLPDEVVARSLALREEFYEALEALVRARVERHGRAVVYDLHSYNHRRSGPDAPPDDPERNPDVNLGTRHLDVERWRGVADAFLDSLRGREVCGRRLDVRENVRFEGGFLGRWITRSFPGSACALSIDVKKFFMDEWTGRPLDGGVEAVARALERTTEPVRRALEAV